MEVRLTKLWKHSVCRCLRGTVPTWRHWHAVARRRACNTEHANLKRTSLPRDCHFNVRHVCKMYPQNGDVGILPTPVSAGKNRAMHHATSWGHMQAKCCTLRKKTEEAFLAPENWKRVPNQKKPNSTNPHIRFFQGSQLQNDAQTTPRLSHGVGTSAAPQRRRTQTTGCEPKQEHCQVKH